MALPPGKHCTYRPSRTNPRYFTAAAIGRAVLSAREHGELCSDIREKVREALLQSGCEETQCDCEKLYVLVTAGIAVATLAIVLLTRNRLAAVEARDAIARAIRTSKDAKVVKDLQTADREIVTMDRDLAKAQREWQRLLDRLQDAEQNSFGSTGVVTIKPPET